MSGIKGFSSSLKNIKPPKAHPQARTEQQFVTVTPTGYDKHGLDVVLKAHYPISALPINLAAIQPTEDPDRVIITDIAHNLRQGDIIRFATGSSLEGIESEILEIVDAFTVVLATKLPSAPVGGADSIESLRGVTLRTGSDGSLVATSGPLQFLVDGVVTQVLKDNVTPANTRALPVEIVAADGTEVNIQLTTGDIGVQLQHDTVNFDSTRIGDGTNLVAVNASNQMEVRDAPAEALLTSLDGKDFATQTTLAALLAAFSAEDFASETTLEAARVLLASIDGKDFGTETTLLALLAELQLKADLSETQPVSLASSPLPTGAATELTLAALLTELQAKADLTETQPISAASLPLPTGAALDSTVFALLTAFTNEDFAQQGTLNSLLVAFQNEDFATETTQALINNKTPNLGLTTGANSVPVVLASDSANIPIEAVTNDQGNSGSVILAGLQVVGGGSGQRRITVQADSNNTDSIRIGIGVGTPTTTEGYELLPGASVQLEIGGIGVNCIPVSGTQKLNFLSEQRS